MLPPDDKECPACHESPMSPAYYCACCGKVQEVEPEPFRCNCGKNESCYCVEEPIEKDGLLGSLQKAHSLVDNQFRSYEGGSSPPAWLLKLVIALDRAIIAARISDQRREQLEAQCRAARAWFEMDTKAGIPFPIPRGEV